MEHALEPTADPAWVLDVEGYDPLREGSLESRFAISNGFLGIRGARATTRGARWIVPPRTAEIPDNIELPANFRVLRELIDRRRMQ